MHTKNIHISNTIPDARLLRQKYPDDIVALPPHLYWYNVDDAKDLHHPNVCATLIDSFPFRALHIVNNTPVRCILRVDKLLEIQDNNIVVHNCNIME